MNKGDFVRSHHSLMDITFTNKRKIKPDPELIEETKKKKQRFNELEDKRLERELEDWF